MMKQLFLGLQHIQKMKVIHGDIKIENIFVQSVNNNGIDEYEYHIGDFRNAKYSKTEMPLTVKGGKHSNPFATTVTKGYFTSKDSNKLCKALFKDKNHDQWIQLQEKRDIYALAATIWAALTRTEPYSLPESGLFPTIQNEGSPLEEKSFKERYGSEITCIMVRALKEDPEKRPTVDEILKVIEQAFEGIEPDFSDNNDSNMSYSVWDCVSRVLEAVISDIKNF